MCGIVGYYGPKDTAQVLVNGLKKLEYRGYDSAGVAILDGSHIGVVRAKGKLSALEEKLKKEQLHGNLGIGHTRWATHGIPSERNAHPHTVDGVCLVHNGIIENYNELKEELVKAGSSFASDTDSEVVAHLVARELKTTPDLLKAVQRVIPILRGAYAILVIWDEQPGHLVAFKNGPPLLVGLGEQETFVASDAHAVLPYTNQVIYLDDGEVAHVEDHKITVFDAHGGEVQKKVTTINWGAEEAEKKGFKHYMLKEIFEQPKSVSSVLQNYVDLDSQKVKMDDLHVGPLQSSTFSDADLKNAERIFILACGTSYYAGMYAKYIIEKLAKVPVEIDFASEFRYREPVIPKKSLVIVISQSGETADTLAVLRQAKEAGAQVLSITNTKGSTIDRESHAHLYMHAGVEIGVASTKALISTLTVLNLLAVKIGLLRDTLPPGEDKTLISNLLALPSQMEAVLSYDKFFAKTSDAFKKYKGFLYLGRGASYPIAMEGALKLKELAYMHAEGYAAGEMKHGPLALIDENMLVVVICPKDQHYEKTMSNLQEAKARGGQIISIGTGDDEALKALSLHYLSLPESHWSTTGILSTIPLQLMAYHVADVLGYDVDQPRNLAKSVTVE